ncbi:MAG: 4Fe-4S binding protein [Dehalococcoidia bacterium]|nr:4Fe-4S binding protein [Dehalococcoidia bacterium]
MIDHKSAESPDKVHIYRRWCKQCDICIAFCPKKALAPDTDQYPELAYPERCNQCGLCQMRCPDFAISVTPRPKKDKGTPQEQAP